MREDDLSSIRPRAWYSIDIVNTYFDFTIKKILLSSAYRAPLFNSMHRKRLAVSIKPSVDTVVNKMQMFLKSYIDTFGCMYFIFGKFIFHASIIVHKVCILFIFVWLKPICRVKSYSGSFDKTHDIVAIICDAPVIWWPRRACAEWPKIYVLSLWLVVCTFDRIDYASLFTPMITLDGMSPEIMKFLTTNFIILSQTKPWQYQ